MVSFRENPAVTGLDTIEIKAGQGAEPGKFFRRQMEFVFQGRRERGEIGPTGRAGNRAINTIRGDYKFRPKISMRSG
jgi:hypothetical protein